MLQLIQLQQSMLQGAAKALKLGNLSDLAEKIGALHTELKEKNRQIEILNQKLSDLKMAAVFDNAKMVKGIKVVSSMLTGITPQMLRKMGDTIKSMDEPVIAVLAGVKRAICSAHAPSKHSKMAHMPDKLYSVLLQLPVEKAAAVRIRQWLALEKHI